MANDLQTKKQDITVLVLDRVRAMQDSKQLTIPSGYSPENALRSAYLIFAQNPKLQQCTPVSQMQALLDMICQGLSPSKHQVYFIPRGNNLTLQRSYMGTLALAKRIGGVKDVVPQIVYKNDDFQYEIDTITGEYRILKHEQDLENIEDSQYVAAYAVVHLEDGTNHVELMNKSQIQKAWSKSSNPNNAVTKDFQSEMIKRTIINRAVKRYINSSDDSDLFVDAYNRTLANEFDNTPKKRKEIPDVLADIDDEPIAETVDEDGVIQESEVSE
jgi:recombination protein RecT